MNCKSALITGITGQSGSYLAELLLSKGYVVHGLIRRSSNFNTQRIEHLYRDPHVGARQLILHYGDLLDAPSLYQSFEIAEPDEIYNLAGQSHVKVSFEMPEYTFETVATGTLRMLECFRKYARYRERLKKPAPHFYQAGSSEMFGNTPAPQNELTPFQPRSPYATAKLAAHWHCVNYREAYGLFISNGILFNHESPRRGETFVTRKITKAVGRIKAGLQDKLYLGNLDARRDWGYAGDYVEAMWRMLQKETPDDFVIATGESRSVREFVDAAFIHAGGLNWHDHVEIDPSYYRPTEVDALRGDARKARDVLSWKPQIGFHELVRMMVNADALV